MVNEGHEVGKAQPYKGPWATKSSFQSGAIALKGRRGPLEKRSTPKIAHQLSLNGDQSVLQPPPFPGA